MLFTPVNRRIYAAYKEMQAIQSIFCSKIGNIAREINGCFLNKTSHIMVFMHKNKRFMHKCIHMHKKKTRELHCIISDVTRREREQKKHQID